LHKNEYFGLDTDDTIDVLDVEVERNYSTNQLGLNLQKTTFHEDSVARSNTGVQKLWPHFIEP